MPRSLGYSLIVATVFALFSQAAAQQKTFPLYCRGPLTYVTGTGVGFTLVFFQKNNRHAGDKGAFLAKGTCSWADRVISPDEPSKLILGEYKVPPTLGPDWRALNAKIPAFISCNHDERCSFMLRVYHDNKGHFSYTEDSMFVYFPTFR